MNVFFNFRQPAPSVPPLAVLIISYPLGKFLAFVLPITTYRLPRWLGGIEFSLNPGPWNIKEHVLVYIMANVATGPPYAINAIVVAQMNYNFQLDYWFSALLVVATQLTGFGLAGMCRRFLVWPASMVWPQNLVTCTLLNTLHAEDEDELGGISRYRYFLYVLAGSFFFFFIPGKSSPFSSGCFTSSFALRLSLQSPICIFLDMLDTAKQRPHQPTIWRQFRNGNDHSYVRLVANSLDRQPPHVPLVGASPHLFWLCHVLLDHHTYYVLHQRASLSLPSFPCGCS